MKRLRKPKLKDGELRVYWGRPDRHDCPDVVLAWQGHRSTARYRAASPPSMQQAPKPTQASDFQRYGA